nr:immunoglobulin light chain junction region [Macaca mulatta]MPO03381.1 immunoglobulin light chain junction region [Macaca mulatta]MPO04839.1 immunoglobulin light chain junction region [Macaca mulatta]MPO05070.1 immunoglobulin light chain junction region [Macaca mulatta]MPO05152.1 immunoglobulin light chain junction region [Macaca mulatta]
CSSYAGSSVFF